MKLIRCGGEDNAVLADWLGRGDLEMVAALSFASRLDPAIAAAHQFQTSSSAEAPSPEPSPSQALGQVALAPVWRSLAQLQRQYSGVLIEGVGSLSSAITGQANLADVAADWKLPVLLVAAVTPQTLSELIAQTAVARLAGCDLRGILLNCPTATAQASLMDWAPPKLVQQMTGYPVLGKIPYLGREERSVERLALVAAEFDWERILPS